MSSADEQVYSAENAWLESLRLAADRGGFVRYGIVHYEPEGIVKFAGVEDIRTFVRKVLAHIGRDPEAISVREASQGFRKAHYDYIRKEIEIPKREKGGGWALNSAVVLHEISHHIAGPTAGHDQPFRLAFVRLLEDLGQPENARLLQACYQAHGLGVLKASTTEATITRIGKVLRQAEAAATEGEREVFLAKAQEMATRHSVTLATARAHQARTEERTAPVAWSYVVGERRQRGLAQLIHLIMGIGHANSVKFTIYGNNTGVTMYGFREDIDLTIALYESCYAQMVADCEAYLATDEWKGEWVWSEKKLARVPITKITARLAFNNAYQFRIGRRLAEAKRKAEDKIKEKTESTALVLRGKEVEVRDAYTAATRKITRTWSGGRITDSVRAEAAGDKAARSAVLGTERALS